MSISLPSATNWPRTKYPFLGLRDMGGGKKRSGAERATAASIIAAAMNKPSTRAARAQSAAAAAPAPATSRTPAHGLSNSEGAGVSAQQSHFFSAHTRGFRGGYASSRHSFSVAPIASLPGRNAEMQRDAWYSSMRDATELASPEAVGRYAAQRALSRLGSRK